MAWHACTCILTLRASITPLVNLSGTAAHYWFCWISALSGWNNYLCRQGRHAGSIMCPLSPVWSRWGGGPGQHWTIMLLLGLYNKNFNCKNKAIWTPNFEIFFFFRIVAQCHFSLLDQRKGSFCDWRREILSYLYHLPLYKVKVSMFFFPSKKKSRPLRGLV